MTLDELIKRKAHAQAREKQLREHWDGLQAAFQLEHQELITRLEAATNELLLLDRMIDQAAMEQFKESGEKQPHPAVRIKRVQKFVYNEQAAVDWAMEMGKGNLLSIKRGMFNDLVKAGKVPDEVAIITEEFTVAQQSRLGEYLLTESENGGTVD